MENNFVASSSSSSKSLVERDLINCLEREYWADGLDLNLSLQTPIKTCSFCKIAKTPTWRKGPDGKTLCNACGLRYKRNEMKLTLTLSPPNPIARVIRRRGHRN